MRKLIVIIFVVSLLSLSGTGGLTFRSSIGQNVIGESAIGNDVVKSGIIYLDNSGGKSKSGKTEPLNIPLNYELKQNYPNPFNPTTTISFSLPVDQFVSLKVYNILGNEVAVLAGKDFTKGKHEVVFNADRFVSGLYFYKIQTPGFSKMKKMMIVK
ncbi:MAG: T9SS type A sorting domain-containing protein [Candidatus Delongbacteria bacterium]|nr:T9SS type A sorting domain-containing protein [Candidatus Delongbacteria bacterium]MCG2759599.1 T9SS type A sorting domain-containing protein [Candidatus Delongbacteria bacterium]